jgi:hypothetical protein
MILFIVSVSGQIHAVYIPENKLTSIIIDGKVGDWNWVPDNYYISHNQMEENKHNLTMIQIYGM